MALHNRFAMAKINKRPALFGRLTVGYALFNFIEHNAGDVR
jgi:hypothetical protein